MPAKSEKQRELMAIAEHRPDKLYARNRGVLSMDEGQLHDFAVKPHGGFQSVVKAKKKYGRR